MELSKFLRKETQPTHMTLCFMMQTAPSFIHLGYKVTSRMLVVSTGISIQGTV